MLTRITIVLGQWPAVYDVLGQMFMDQHIAECVHISTTIQLALFIKLFNAVQARAMYSVRQSETRRHLNCKTLIFKTRAAERIFQQTRAVWFIL